MSNNSKIEWTDHTFNPWEGCQKVGPGCDHCYAETRNARFAGGTAVNWGPGAPRRRTSVSNWRKPLQWNNSNFFQCRECGWRGHQTASLSGVRVCPKIKCASARLWPARPRVFCASLADVFDNAIDPTWRRDLFDLIGQTPNLDWLLLTKRIGNVMSMVSETAQYQFDLECLQNPRMPENVWIGATIVNQEEADRDIPKLLKVPAQVHFLSMEPLLGPVDLERPMPGPDLDQGGGGKICQPWMILSGIDWVIVGGESGTDARPMHPEWARGLRDQCEAAGVPFLFKQWGEWAPGENCGGPMKRSERVADWWNNEWEFSTMTPGSAAEMHVEGEPVVYRCGKKAAGRMLDGRTHDEFPCAAHRAN